MSAGASRIDALLPTPIKRPILHSAGSLPSAVLRDRYRGALVGSAAGDALGRPAEGRSPAALRATFGELREFKRWRGWRDGPIGTWTDDTQMTICVARSLVDTGGVLEPEDLARRFIEWLPEGRGIGATCRGAVLRLTGGTDWRESGLASAGNGAAMRAAPVGLAHPSDIDALRGDAALSAVITHADAMAVASTIVQAFAVAYCTHHPVGTLDPAQFLDAIDGVLQGVSDPAYLVRGGANAGGTASLGERIRDIGGLLNAEPATAFGHFHNGAFVLESLPAALWCFLRFRDDPEEAIVAAVAGGYDADTVAAMTGALVGAYNGEVALPSRWTNDVEGLEELRELADVLLAIAHPQPETGERQKPPAGFVTGSQPA